MVPLHTLWCIKIQRGTSREHQLSISYRMAAERILVAQETTEGLQPNIPVDNGQQFPPVWIYDRFKSYWWWLFVVVGTTSFVTAAVITIAW